MSSLRIRPRFKDQLSMTAVDFRSVLQTALDETEECTGLITESYCVLKIPTEERHYWSPQLSLSLEQEESDKLWVRGLYGPRPSVWSVFFMSYAAIGIIILFVGVIGLSKLMLDKSAPILWLIPVLGVIALVLYLVAQAGQKVGAEQMFRLHHFYEHVTRHKVSVA